MDCGPVRRAWCRPRSRSPWVSAFALRGSAVGLPAGLDRWTDEWRAEGCAAGAATGRVPLPGRREEREEGLGVSLPGAALAIRMARFTPGNSRAPLRGEEAGHRRDAYATAIGLIPPPAS